MSNEERDQTVEGKLRAITIEHFRGIERLDLAFQSPKGDANPIVVFAGPNGGGKTSVLEACLLAAGQDRVVIGPTGCDAIRFGAEEYAIEGEFLQPDGKTFHQRRTPQIGATLRFPCLYLHSGRTDSLVGPLSITMGRRSSQAFSLERESREAFVSTHSPYRVPGPSVEPSRLEIIKQNMINAWAHSLVGVKPGSSTVSNRYTSLIQWIDRLWAMFYPDADQRFAVDSSGSDPDEGFDVFLFGPGETRLPVDFLSSGQLELFTLAGATGLLKSTLQTVFIDEIELHLDPQWHRLILHALRTLMPETQFIVTTHSPEVYNSVRSFERHFLVPDDDPRARSWADRLKVDAER